MSALDYLYKKLYWLVNRIETLSQGKISKRDLLIYSLIFIFILSVYFGGVIGAFTFILALATIWNAIITQGLSKRSEEALEQSRISFLVDIVDRTIEYIEKLPAHQKRVKQTSYIRNKARAIKKISIERSVEFLEAMVDWQAGKNEEVEREFEETKEELKEQRKKFAKWLGWEIT